MKDMNFSSPLFKVRGVGQKTYEQFVLSGISTVFDLINFLPRTVEDFTNVSKIGELKPGKVTIQAHCQAVSTRSVRRGMRITTATLADDTGKVQAVWFNQPYRAQQLSKTDEEFYFSGEFEFNYNRYQLSNPSAEKISDTPISSDRLVPIYPAIRGLKCQLVRKVLIELKPIIPLIPEILPSEIVAQNQLISRAEAYQKIHFPSSLDDLTLARKRLAFDEVFGLVLASQLNKQENSKLEGPQMPFNQLAIKQFVAKLPFELTSSQRRAAWEILQDFEKATPMNRLLQGDVGAGKTVVAGIAARQAAVSGYQTAIMAPTEILASQHAESLIKLLEPFGVKVGLLTGGVTGKARQTLYDNIVNGSVDVVIGTHALIQDAVRFHKLGLVVIDEQHRFGVEQRQKLLEKANKMPHMLSMTATPIPRSLSLTLYGELDISILSDMPKGRKPIISKLWSPNSRTQLYELVEAELSSGRQAYVICSLIDDNPDSDKKSVESEYRRLKAVFKNRRIGVLHGKLKPAEKDQIMSDFKMAKLDILVSTTVVEVGVDVPNATVMIIENADHFGLAQLHQLRGRVGRSSLQSYCYLVMSDSKRPSQRLREIEKSNDGFYLAEVDLKLRGPGEIYGKSQHGALNLRIATLADTKLISSASKGAKWFIDENIDMAEFPELSAEINRYQKLTTLN